MRRRMQYAPRGVTILVALVLVLVGVVCTFGPLLNDTVGVAAFLAAELLLLLGVFFERI
jgi:hypothetical protein